jgi:hypothetical protein
MDQTCFAGICFNSSSTYTILVIIAIIFFSILFQYIEDRNYYKQKYDTLAQSVVNSGQNIVPEQKQKKLDDLDAVVNPLRPPLRKNINMNNGTVKDPRINIPTQGEYSTWHQVGILTPKKTDNVETIMPLFGRRLHSDNWEYYTTHHLNTSLKIPMEDVKRELYDGDEVSVIGYQSKFIVEIYDFDKPRYIPYL